jgi:transcriptional regulator with XRE-family HTH domain
MASSWKSLPIHLSDPARLLTERLREVKDVQSLSLSEIARRTHYSKASWQRWLNGERLVTVQALEALLAQVGGDAECLRALLARADAPTVDDTAAAPDPAPLPLPLPDDVPVPGSPASDAAPLERPLERPAGSGAEEDVAEVPAPAGSGNGAAGEDSPAVRPGRSWLREPGLLLSSAGLATIVVLAAACVTLLVDPPSRSGATPSPAAASAAPSAATVTQGAPDCLGIGCIGKDPQLTGCGADAVTLLTGNVGKVILYIRYSPSCHAAWAKLTDGAPKDRATITTSAGQSATALIHWGYDAYSPMVDASGPKVILQVCGRQPQGQGCTMPISDPAARRWPSQQPPAYTSAPVPSAPPASPISVNSRQPPSQTPGSAE